MDIEQTRELLKSKNIRYTEREYETEKEYWRHICEYYYCEHASDDRVKAFVIPCRNGKRNIELQLTEREGEYVFTELYFGTFCFELSEADLGESIGQELEKHLDNLLNGRYTVVSAADLKAGRLVFDGFSIDLPSETKTSLIEKLIKANGFIGKLRKQSFAYEIYDNKNIVTGEFNSMSKFWKATKLLREREIKEGQEQ